ncbi:MAG: hypothetical protein HYT36_02685 [Candidatus Staskawiczbacteria bacterium]|nr:hypothetical protein [Candidatus Staskawiczbacteria bacterium]
MKHIWSILCQNSSVDSKTNLLSIFNCVEELKIEIKKDQVSKTDLLVIPISFQLISFWTIEDANQKNSLYIKLEIIDPNEKLLNDFNKSFDIAEGTLRFRNIINIQNIKIAKEGRYMVKVFSKENDKKGFKAVAELPLDIKIEYI